MLVPVPRGAPPESAPADAENEAFETALRRDLRSTTVVSYETVLGGWVKRGYELAIVVLTAPLWAPLLLLAAAILKQRLRQPVFYADERIGYGGQYFRCFKLRLSPLADEGAQAAAQTLDEWEAIKAQAQSPGVKWRYAWERLPQLVNVLRGDMALVGPTPLSEAQLAQLKHGRRHYFGARPGIVGISGILEPGDDKALQYKAYSKSWSFMTDALLFFEAARWLRHRGELWRPAAVRPKPKVERLMRRRSGP